MSDPIGRADELVVFFDRLVERAEAKAVTGRLLDNEVTHAWYSYGNPAYANTSHVNVYFKLNGRELRVSVNITDELTSTEPMLAAIGKEIAREVLRIGKKAT